MSDRTVSASFPFPTLLGLLFITLKLVGVIDWSWWWVLAPLWTPVALLVVVVGVFYLLD